MLFGKLFCNERISEPVLHAGLVYKCKRIIGKLSFSDQFWAGWFEPHSVGNHNDRFSRVGAKFCVCVCVCVGGGGGVFGPGYVLSSLCRSLQA